jgi:hypothetical protein
MKRGDVVKPFKGFRHGWDVPASWWSRVGIIIDVIEHRPCSDQYIVYWCDGSKSVEFVDNLEMK